MALVARTTDPLLLSVIKPTGCFAQSGRCRRAASRLIRTKGPLIHWERVLRFWLTDNGTGFTSNSILGWNDESRPTTLISSTQLKAEISAPDISTPGTARVTVFDVSPGGGTSPPVTFTIDPVPVFSLGFDQS